MINNSYQYQLHYHSMRNFSKESSKLNTKDDFDVLVSNLEDRLQEEAEEEQQDDLLLDKTQPYIYQQRGSVILIRGINHQMTEGWQYGKLIQINEKSTAIILSILENQVIALLLDSDRSQRAAGQNISEAKITKGTVKLGFGGVQTVLHGNHTISDAKDSYEVDLNCLRFDRPTWRRKIVEDQLYTGHLRIDMADPLTQGNFIVLKGDKRASGKHLVIEGAISNFLQDDESNRLVYASLSSARSQKILSTIDKKLHDQIAFISADQATQDEAEQYLVPK